MQKIYVKDLINKFNGKLIIGNENLELTNFSKDTRTINQNDIYVAIRGEVFDGNKFYQEALDKGAIACILDNFDESSLDKEKYQDKTIILVEDTVKCLQQLAGYKRSLYDIPVIAITGSVGKTSTKDMVASVLSKKYKVLKTEGNNNSQIGLPLTILKLEDHNCLVVEMGMNHLKEISLLTNVAKPTMAIITNVTTAHIGLLGSRENILKAKLEILEGLTKDKIIIINNDNDMLHTANISNEYHKVTVGIDNESDFMAKNISKDTKSIFDIIHNGNKTKIEVPIPTTPFIYNSLIAYAIGILNNVSENDIKDAIKNTELSNNRLARHTNKNGITIIDDTYNASYDSMKMALEILGKEKNRKVAILGDMLELGNYSKQIHENIGKEVVNNNVDILITVGIESNYIEKSAIENGFNKENTYHFNNAEECYNNLNEILKSNDTVLLKASHSIGLTSISNKLINE